jgi:hypothetical protein
MGAHNPTKRDQDKLTLFEQTSCAGRIKVRSAVMEGLPLSNMQGHVKAIVHFLETLQCTRCSILRHGVKGHWHVTRLKGLPEGGQAGTKFDHQRTSSSSGRVGVHVP